MIQSIGKDKMKIGIWLQLLILLFLHPCEPQVFKVHSNNPDNIPKAYMPCISVPVERTPGAMYSSRAAKYCEASATLPKGGVSNSSTICKDRTASLGHHGQSRCRGGSRRSLEGKWFVLPHRKTAAEAAAAAAAAAAAERRHILIFI